MNILIIGENFEFCPNNQKLLASLKMAWKSEKRYKTDFSHYSN